MSDGIERPANTFCGRMRREFLWQAGGAFTSVALAGMLSKEGFLEKQALDSLCLVLFNLNEFLYID
jgi:hypothetical protein